jgi:hypothetical protein
MNSEDYLFSCCGIVCTPFMAKALGHSIENMHVHSSNVDERRLVTSESSSALDLRPNVVFLSMMAGSPMIASVTLVYTFSACPVLDIAWAARCFIAALAQYAISSCLHLSGNILGEPFPAIPVSRLLFEHALGAHFESHLDVHLAMRSGKLAEAKLLGDGGHVCGPPCVCLKIASDLFGNLLVQLRSRFHYGQRPHLFH